MSTIHQQIVFRKELIERCTKVMAAKGVSIHDLVDAALEDALENVDELVFRKQTSALKLKTTAELREDLVLKLSPFSKLDGVAFAPNALKEYRVDCPGLTRQQITQEIERLSGRTAFKKRIGNKTAHIVPLTANRATPADSLTYIHYVRAALNGGEGKFTLSTERQERESAPQPAPLPTIDYSPAPSVLSYDDDEPRGGDDYGWKWS
jgi:hypothetical protein